MPVPSECEGDHNHPRHPLNLLHGIAGAPEGESPWSLCGRIPTLRALAEIAGTRPVRNRRVYSRVLSYRRHATTTTQLERRGGDFLTRSRAIT
jgi:hypothetical protein